MNPWPWGAAGRKGPALGWREAGERLRLLVRKCGLKERNGRRNAQVSEKSLFCNSLQTTAQPQTLPSVGLARGCPWAPMPWMWQGYASGEAIWSPPQCPSICP